MRFEARYTESDGWYTFTLYGPHPTAVDLHRPIFDRPEWLTNIVTIATVGEHFLSMPNPPPDRILWFFIDEACNLVDIDTFV